MTERGARAVHGGIATADDDDIFADAEWLAEVGIFHEVHAVDEAVQVSARDVQRDGVHCAGADRDCVVLLLQLFEGNVATNLGVVDKLHAESLDEAHICLNCFARQSECGNANEHRAATVRQAVVHGDLVALDGELPRNGETGRAGADHGDALGTWGDLWCNVWNTRRSVPLHKEALHCANREWSIDVAAAAGALTWRGADVRTHCGNGVWFAGEQVALFKATFGGKVEVAAAVGANRAGLLALDVALKPGGVYRLDEEVLRFKRHSEPFGVAVGHCLQGQG